MSEPKRWSPEIMQRRLHDLRMARGESCAMVSSLCGLGKNAVGKYESGESIPTIETAFRLARHFGVSISYLLGYDK